jgi:hypothetical protein
MLDLTAYAFTTLASPSLSKVGVAHPAMSLTCDTNDLETFYYHQDTANLVYVVYLTSLLKPGVLHHLHIIQFVYNSNHNMVLRPCGPVRSVHLSKASTLGLLERATSTENDVCFVV